VSFFLTFSISFSATFGYNVLNTVPTCRRNRNRKREKEGHVYSNPLYIGLQETCCPGVFSIPLFPFLCVPGRYKVGLYHTWRSWYKNFWEKWGSRFLPSPVVDGWLLPCLGVFLQRFSRWHCSYLLVWFIFLSGTWCTLILKVFTGFLCIIVIVWHFSPDSRLFVFVCNKIMFLTFLTLTWEKLKINYRLTRKTCTEWMNEF
jgi:hypothetical protein